VVAVMEYLGTGQVLRLTGLTFRQLDHMLRRHMLALPGQNTPGMGKRRYYTPEQVRRLQVGAAVGLAMGSWSDQGILPSAVRYVMSGPSPMPTNLVAITHEVQYIDTVAEIQMEPPTATVLVKMPELWPDVSPETYKKVMGT
jgi:DNA-binding transcriptional MerR regulator